MLEVLIPVILATIFNQLLNYDTMDYQKDNQLELQGTAQAFEHDEAELAYKRQEEFYNKYQSPQALIDQYRSTGASENASMMAALGVTPSAISAPQAHNGAGSAAGGAPNTIQDVFSQLTKAAEQYSQTKLNQEQLPWVAPINEATVKKSLGELEINWKRLGLDYDQYKNVAVPLANAQIFKTDQEIQESKARVQQIGKEMLRIIAEIENLEKQGYMFEAQGNLAEAQSMTEGFKQQNLAADTALKGSQKELTDSQKTGQDLQNRLDQLTVELSEELGQNITLPWTNQLIVASDKTLGKTIKEFIQGVDTTFDAILSTNRYRNMARQGLDMFDEFTNEYYPYYRYLGVHGIPNAIDDMFEGDFKMPKFSPEYQSWLKKRGERYKRAQEWIERNTRYGYN